MEQMAYEKLGVLYLGRELDGDGDTGRMPFLYKSAHLTTHAAIIGMTGSGKTGLGIGLIEEAIMDDIPSIIIDPKGDMGNLLLTFPDLRPEDFTPWLDPQEAVRKGMDLPAYGARTAENWRQGLADWDQPLERIATLRAKGRMTIYTPGSSAGVGISVLGALTPPSQEVLADLDTLNSLVASTVTSLLTLVDVQGDPLQSREHILLSSLLLHFWRKGEPLSLEQLIGNVVSPPFPAIGVFPLDTFFPQPERMELAMRFNNVMASPAFAGWLTGEPLDIQRLLYTEEGRPRTAIFSIAHLGESERMFFVTLLLSRFIDWMRRQPGTSSLRALLYMDEIFGYFPPTANPPSKKPMLLLLKQARAFGCGVVLATQNPVDLDYKGLSNIGSWFVGRLQTSQDQERVAAGIAGASGGAMSAAEVKQLLGTMKGRQFVLKSAHLDRLVPFATRWVMSFLRGPIGAPEIKRLMADRNRQQAVAAAQPVSRVAMAGDGYGVRPMLSPEIDQCFYLQNMLADEVLFEPWLLAMGRVRFTVAAKNIDELRDVALRIPLAEHLDRIDWQQAEPCAYTLDECVASVPETCRFAPLPQAITSLKNLTGAARLFRDYLYQYERLELLRVPRLKLDSLPGETSGDFTVRLQDILKKNKDEAVAKLERKYGGKQQQLEDQLQRALHRLEKEQIDVKAKTTDTVLSFGVAVIGALFGRKTVSATTMGRAATTVRSAGRVVKEKGDVRRVEEEVRSLEQKLTDVQQEIEKELAAVADLYTPENYPMETVAVKPKKSDIHDLRLALVWEMVPPLG